MLIDFGQARGDLNNSSIDMAGRSYRFDSECRVVVARASTIRLWRLVEAVAPLASLSAFRGQPENCGTAQGQWTSAPPN